MAAIDVKLLDVTVPSEPISAVLYLLLSYIWQSAYGKSIVLMLVCCLLGGYGYDSTDMAAISYRLEQLDRYEEAFHSFPCLLVSEKD